VEDTAVPVGPVHHRGDGEAVVLGHVGCQLINNSASRGV
jgi:hypothetical protein